MDIEYTIHDRLKKVKERTSIGQWEGDTVRSEKWNGFICTHVKRLSRYVVKFKIPDWTVNSFAKATMISFWKFPKGNRKSFTTDYGKEFAGHRESHAKLNCKDYFVDHHAPWQRRTNENFNDLLRQFFSKRTS